MAYPDYLRHKARELRAKRHLSLDEIAERLALPRGTVWYWISDLPLGRPRRANPGQRLGNLAMQAAFKAKREAAYAEGVESFARLAEDRTFRDFVCLYMAEGYKRSRNRVSLCNSDPTIVKLAARWIRAMARNPISYSLQYHADQDLTELRGFWGGELEIDPNSVRVQRKSNSNQLAGRNWRSQYGVLNVIADDTLLRSRIEAWMNCLRDTWAYTDPPYGA